jgi:diguanylate cyclase (GGDEF)-like protein
VVAVLVRTLQGRAVARASVAVLALGVFVLAGLALWSTSSTRKATARVGTANELGDVWGQLFDHVNLEEDMMHAYVGTRDDSQRAAFKQTIGGAEPILATLRTMGDGQDQVMAKRAEDAYQTYTDALQGVLDAPPAANLEMPQQRGRFAAAAMRQLVSASMSSERQEMRAFNRQVDADSERVRVATTIAFTACLALLAVCLAVLLGYQRRVERQAASHRHDSLHDALTKLPNRTLFGQRTEAAMGAAARHGEQVGLLMIDLDGFKQVNDTMGHVNGDLLLQEVAGRLTHSVRGYDTVARLGGDEFAVLLPRLTAPDEADEIAHRVLSALRQPFVRDGVVLEVGGSIGIAIYPNDCENAEQLLQHADIAMYVAKRGRLGVQGYAAHQDAGTAQQLTMLAQLRSALDRNLIEVHYQPKVDTGTGRIRGVEALARWHHPERGMIGPLEFIPLAEQNGLIDQLTHQVLAQSLNQCRQWRADGIHLPVAVNLSTRCLADPALIDVVAGLLRDTEVEPGMLTLEITESAMIANAEEAIAVLTKIRELGIRLSIDDFGTGYSSMAHLHQLPIDELKIDKRFVSRIGAEAKGRVIVRAIVGLAHGLDLQVVAEGVEDRATLEQLRLLGCGIGQGYLFSKPLAAAELAPCIAGLGVAGDPVRAG